jgi:hypothetical protein
LIREIARSFELPLNRKSENWRSLRRVKMGIGCETKLKMDQTTECVINSVSVQKAPDLAEADGLAR